MFWLLLKKELRVFFSSKGNLAVMLLLPILLLAIFGSALGSYMQADYRTFEDGVVYYYNDGTDAPAMTRFHDIAAEIQAATGVTFTEVTDITKAQATVEASKAYGVVSIHTDGYTYFRSTFNEPEGGKLTRNLFVQLADPQPASVDTTGIRHTVITAQPVDSRGYYTFASLAFSILFMGLLVGFSVHNEKALGTIERIQLSSAGVGRMFTVKVLTGVVCGIGQIAVVFAFSSLAFGVSWGPKCGFIFSIFLLLSLYSSVFGGVVGLLCKNKSMCQNVVLMVSMLSGYLGGSITPLYLLENAPVMNIIVNISPLYWVNQAITRLRNNMLDESVLYAVLVLVVLIAVVALVGMLATRKVSPVQGVRKEVAA